MIMEKISVNTFRSYPVFIGEDLFNEAVLFCKNNSLGDTAYIISDENVFSILGGRLKEFLTKEFETFETIVPAEESSKSMDFVLKVIEDIVQPIILISKDTMSY